MIPNNEIFTSPEKCIAECNKQIEFSQNLIVFLEQYITQLETIKGMAQSAKAMQEVNPFKMMMQFAEAMSNLTPGSTKSDEPAGERQPDAKKE